MSRSLLTLGSAAAVLLLFGAGLARGATSTEYQFFPNEETPTDQGWTRVDTNDQDHNVTVVGGEHLELENGATGDNGPFFQQTDSAVLPGPEDDWEARHRFRVQSHGEGGWASDLQLGDTEGNVARARWKYDGTSTTVELAHAESTSNNNGVEIASVSGRPWLEVVMSKETGSDASSLADDTVTAKVFDVETGNEEGSVSKPFENMANTFSRNRLFFGLPYSNGIATVETTGATFAVAEDTSADVDATAPAINVIPEPASLTLLAPAGLLALRRRRR